MRNSILALAAVVLAVPSAARAGGPPCDVRLLEGDYGLQIAGTRVLAPGAPAEQVIGVGTARFDGSGGYSLQGTTHGSISGVAADTPGTGTYSVNPDCTGEVVFQNANQPFPLRVAIAIVDRGDEIKGITVAPLSVMVSATWTRK